MAGRDVADGRHEDERPPWLEVDDPPGPATGTAPSRSRWLFAAAALPWLVVGLLVARPATGGPADPPAAAPTPDVGHAPAGTEAPADPSATATDAPSLAVATTATITSSGALVAVDEDEARAVAVVAARRWLTTVGPGATAGSTADPVYAEHLVVEGVDHPAPGAAVVTVRAIVLRVAGDGYDDVEVRRLAVPLRFDAGGAAPAGTPYPLPVDDPVERSLEPTEAVDDPELLLAAGEALAGAGYDDIDVRSLHRTTSWPLVVTAQVRVGDGPPGTLAVWLRPHLGRLVVAGTRPRPTTADPDLPSSTAGASDDAGPSRDPEEVAP